MSGFIIRRLLWTIPVLLLATLLTFLLVQAMPGEAYDDPKLTEQARENLRAKYGLDEPWHVQYAHFLGDLASGEIGPSTRGGETLDIIAEKLPRTLVLGVFAFALAGLVGTPLGVLSAMRTNTPIDWGVTFFSTIFFALPSFTVALYWGNTFPSWSGWDDWWERIGPITVLGLSIMPYFVRLTRASTLETLQADYVTTARSKGLQERVVIFRHVVRNSLIPTVVNAAPLFGFILTGSFIIETIFIVPGIAREYVVAFQTPVDTRMVLGLTVLLAAFIVVLNLVADIILGLLDPRVSRD